MRIIYKLKAFGFIEVLISLAIMSVGLLGVALLQIQSMQLNNSFRQKDIAKMLVDDMASRIRANAVEQGNNFKRTAASPNGGYIITDIPAQICTDTITATILPDNRACTPAQLAEYEIWNWQEIIAQNLPGGKGTVCSASPTVGAVTNSGIPPCDDSITDGTDGVSPLVIIVWWDRSSLNTSIAAPAPTNEDQFYSIVQRVDL